MQGLSCASNQPCLGEDSKDTHNEFLTDDLFTANSIVRILCAPALSVRARVSCVSLCGRACLRVQMGAAEAARELASKDAVIGKLAMVIGI